MSGSSSRTCRRPRRNSAWSSTISTLTGSPPEPEEGAPAAASVEPASASSRRPPFGCEALICLPDPGRARDALTPGDPWRRLLDDLHLQPNDRGSARPIQLLDPFRGQPSHLIRDLHASALQHHVHEGHLLADACASSSESTVLPRTGGRATL